MMNILLLFGFLHGVVSTSEQISTEEDTLLLDGSSSILTIEDREKPDAPLAASPVHEAGEYLVDRSHSEYTEKPAEDPCHLVDCRKGYTCQWTPVYCLTKPCPQPEPECVPDGSAGVSPPSFEISEEGFPVHWGMPPARPTRVQAHDYIDLPAGYGYGPAILKQWIDLHLLVDAHESGSVLSSTDAPPTTTTAAAPASPYPAYWGEPPGIQTMDYVELPAGYGYGSSTLKEWIELHMEVDAQERRIAPSTTTSLPPTTTTAPTTTPATYPPHWGHPPDIQTMDYRPLPGGWGYGSSTLAQWIRNNMDEDTRRASPSTTTSTNTPLADHVFPTHWGSPPDIQTMDYIELPGDFGYGSSILAHWIQMHMDEDGRPRRASPDTTTTTTTTTTTSPATSYYTTTQAAARVYPTHWGDPPAIQTKDYRQLPGNWGYGSSTLANWIQKNMDEDARRASPATTTTTTPPAAPAYPTHWGSPPEIQTMDYRQLPGDWGYGSSTLANWIQNNMNKDANAKRVPSTTKIPAAAPAYPTHWGSPSAIQTMDYRPLPGGFGYGSSTLGNWIQGNMDKDAAAETSPVSPASTAAAASPWPSRWGQPPEIQTMDYVKLPGGYGFGSSTLRNWIKDKMAAESGGYSSVPVMGGAPSGPAVSNGRFPVHWGPAPRVQTEDLRELPGGYGVGSTTLYNWITKNMVTDGLVGGAGGQAGGSKSNEQVPFSKSTGQDASMNFPGHWGNPPISPATGLQTADYRQLPGGYGFGSSTMYNWVLEKMSQDDKRQPQTLPALPSAFPAHWGSPPDMQTRDYVQLPADYGFGSSTLSDWIKGNLAKDRAGKAQAGQASETAGAERRFPSSWGTPPIHQTNDRRKLPGAFGYGSTTLYNWILFQQQLDMERTRERQQYQSTGKYSDDSSSSSSTTLASPEGPKKQEQGQQQGQQRQQHESPSASKQNGYGSVGPRWQAWHGLVPAAPALAGPSFPGYHYGYTSMHPFWWPIFQPMGPLGYSADPLGYYGSWHPYGLEAGHIGSRLEAGHAGSRAFPLSANGYYYSFPSRLPLPPLAPPHGYYAADFMLGRNRGAGANVPRFPGPSGMQTNPQYEHDVVNDQRKSQEEHAVSDDSSTWNWDIWNLDDSSSSVWSWGGSKDYGYNHHGFKDHGFTGHGFKHQGFRDRGWAFPPAMALPAVAFSPANPPHSSSRGDLYISVPAGGNPSANYQGFHVSFDGNTGKYSYLTSQNKGQSSLSGTSSPSAKNRLKLLFG